MWSRTLCTRKSGLVTASGVVRDGNCGLSFLSAAISADVGTLVPGQAVAVSGRVTSTNTDLLPLANLTVRLAYGGWPHVVGRSCSGQEACGAPTLRFFSCIALTLAPISVVA